MKKFSLFGLMIFVTNTFAASYPNGIVAYQSQYETGVKKTERVLIDWDLRKYSYVDCDVIGGSCAPKEYEFNRYPGNVYEGTIEGKTAVLLKYIRPNGKEGSAALYVLETDGSLSNILSDVGAPFTGGNLLPAPVVSDVTPLDESVADGYWRYESNICGEKCTLFIERSKKHMLVFGALEYPEGTEYQPIEFQIVGTATRGTLSMKYIGAWSAGKGIYFIDADTAMTWTGYILKRVSGPN